MAQAPIFMIEDVDTATQHAATAIAEMAMREISPTPGNFCVWYNYLAGSVPELRRDLDALLLSGKTVSSSNIQELFDKYFREPAAEERLQQTGDELQNTLAEVIRQVTQAGLDANEFGRTLSKASGSLGSGRIDPNAMKDLVGELINATKLIGQRNQALEAQLKQSSTKISALQSRLDQARRDALTDALTGIGNRKSFDLAIQFRSQQANEQKGDLCLLIIDIDHFKKFNDTYGHRVGDHVALEGGGVELTHPGFTPHHRGHHGHAHDRATDHHEGIGLTGGFERALQALGVLLAVLELQRVDRQHLVADLIAPFRVQEDRKSVV